ALDEHVPAGQQRRDQLVHQRVLPDDELADLAPEGVHGGSEAGEVGARLEERLGVVGRRVGGRGERGRRRLGRRLGRAAVLGTWYLGRVGHGVVVRGRRKIANEE